MRARHKIIRDILYPAMRFICRRKFNIQFEKYRGEGPVFVMANHEGDWDPIFLSLMFKFPIYYVASDQLFRNRFVGRLLNFLVAPIPITKMQMDLRTIREMMQTAKEGGSVGLFPEGNRSFSGVTANIPPATGKLAKQLGIRVVLVKQRGGYLTSPRWSEYGRRGVLSFEIARELSVEELTQLTAQQVDKIIADTLYEDAFETQAREMTPFVGREPACYIERALYICPECKGVQTIRSEGDRFCCRECGFGARYNEYGFFEGENLPFGTVTQWYNWQGKQLPKLLKKKKDEPIFSDVGGLRLTERAKRNRELGLKTLVMYRDRISLSDDEKTTEYLFSEMGRVTVVHEQTLQFRAGDENYEFIAAYPSSAVKYMHAYYLLKSKSEGGADIGHVSI